MNSASQRGLPGTRPEGARNEQEAAARVREMFGRIAPRYDLLNHLLSLDIDKIWRRRVAKKFRAILRDENARVLDLCCGTGDLAFAFRREALAGAEIIGSDFVPEMLIRARSKSAASGARVEFVEADALALPFGNASFDLVSCALGSAILQITSADCGRFCAFSSPVVRSRFWNLRSLAGKCSAQCTDFISGISFRALAG